MQNSKKWLLGLIAFAIPEILWSPVTNFVYSFIQNSNHVKVLRPNFLTVADNVNQLLVVITIQLVGIVFTLMLFSKSKMVLKYKVPVIILTLAISFVTGFALFVTFSLRNGIGF